MSTIGSFAQEEQLAQSRKLAVSKGRPPASAGNHTVKKSEGLQPAHAFYIFLAAGALAAIFSPILDCDEVFNYWEPSHYLNHGYGLQTWEYSPVYAIRSWAYAALHSLIMTLPRMVPGASTKTIEFYFMRMVFATAYAACQTRLFSVVSRVMNPRIAVLYLIISTTSPGTFHASTAYLPSSFAMYTTLLGTAAFLDWTGGMRTAQGIMWFGVGATLGWPFAAALVLPFIAEEIFVSSITGSAIETLTRFLDGTVRSVIVLALQTAIDVFFYRKLVIVPLNIVLYNVFGGAGKGPSIFGTEPWHYYLRNLVLNFNLWLLLALASLPLTMIHYMLSGKAPTRQTMVRTITETLPFYLWLGIFTVQPHKEERFIYPAYPFLALNAAIAAHVVLTYLGSSGADGLVAKIPLRLRFALISFVGFAAISLGVLRTAGIVTAFSAPLNVYAPLQQPGMTRPGDTVCIGKEWYRYPSSYFLPHGAKAKFVRSEFKGLLPGEFSEARIGFGLFPGAWLEPPGMNDENREDPGKYTDIERCSFLVDSHFPTSVPSELEPDHVQDTETWEQILCLPFLDASQTGIVGRTIWVPSHWLVPERFRRQWGRYCLLKRKANR